MYVCEQLAGANLSPIVTKLVSHAHGHRDEVIKFWKVKVKGQGRWGCMRSTEPFWFTFNLRIITAVLYCVEIRVKHAVASASVSLVQVYGSVHITRVHGPLLTGHVDGPRQGPSPRIYSVYRPLRTLFITMNERA